MNLGCFSFHSLPKILFQRHANIKSMSNKKLILYGLDASQPCRTVSWLLRAHKVPFEYVQVMPGSKKGTKDPEFMKNKNKAGLVPVLEHGDLVLSESGAIIIYLAEVFGWEDVYPSGPQNAGMRAKINKFLHWMHRNSREFTIGVFAPLFRKDLKFSQDKLDELSRTCKSTLKFMENELAEHGKPFLAGTDVPTLADYAVFADIGQLCKEELDLYDFSEYPKVSAWIQRMRKLPFYEETHEILKTFKTLVDDMKAAQAKL